MTQYGAATPSCPSNHRWRGGARGDTAPTHALRRGCPPSLALLDIAHGYAFTSLRSVGSWKAVGTVADARATRLVVPPRIWGCGAPGAPGLSTGPARPTSSTPFSTDAHYIAPMFAPTLRQHLRFTARAACD
jgi:hypothetical protein